MAEKATDPRDREGLLRLAQDWIELAEQGEGQVGEKKALARRAVQKSAEISWPVGASRRGRPKRARRLTAILEISDGSRTPVAPISITVFATISAIGSFAINQVQRPQYISVSSV